MFKLKSTYSQLALMFGLLLVVNFIIIIAALRQLTIEPTAKQISMMINIQLNSIQKQVDGKSFTQAKNIIAETFEENQVVLSKKPNAKDFPDLKFYKVLSTNLSKKQNLQLQLEESDSASKIWLKPQWVDGYWLGIAFQPFVKKVSRLLLVLIVTLLTLSLLAAYLFSRYMLKPFKRLAKMAVDIAEQKIEPQDFKIRGTREVQEIAQLVKSSAQQIYQLNKEKELLLAGVSHDLRTPLARMRLQAEFLNDEDTRETIISEVEEMDQIIGDFVTYVRSGTIEEFQKTDLSEIITDVVESFAQSNQEIIVEPFNSLLVNLKPLSFKRMLTNIFENAYKYGLPPVVVSIKQYRGKVKIYIVDHGKGISATELESVFEPFVIAHNADNQFGSGLGLSIVKKLAQQNNAKVFAKNHKEGGLEVCIEVTHLVDICF